MNRRGFTLVELLAVIVILAIILSIAVPSISNILDSSRSAAYVNDERLLSRAAKLYSEVNTAKLPANVGDVSIIQLSELKSNNYISDIIDPSDNNTVCDGKVVIGKDVNNNYLYYPYIKCGSNYETYSGYNSSGLILKLDGYNAPVNGYWMDDMSNYNATMVNFDASSGYDTAKKGYKFDGINDYMQLNKLNGITNEITIEGIGIINGYGGSGWVRTLYGWGDEASNLITWLGYGYNLSYRFFSEIGTGTTRVSYYNTDPNPIKVNESFYLSFTYKNGVLSAYKNGEYVANNSIASANISVTANYAYVGTYSAGNHIFNGIIKSIRIYNRALSNDEIKQNYNIDKQRFGL